jgi:TetR/AcrR family transcriptional regulator, transcriptional repressor for nem operon
VSTLPTTDRGRATRERILDTASELFYRQGVTATGLDQVITASRTGKGQLYHYFADKRELIHAVVERQITAVVDAQEAVLASGDLRAWADELIAAYEQGDHPLRCPLGALAVELAESDPEARAALERGFARWADALGGGEMGMALLAAYQGGLLLSQARGNLAPLRAALDVAVRAALGFPGVHSGPCGDGARPGA